VFLSQRIGAAAHEVEDLVQEPLMAVHLKRESYENV
jgi:DNA-directed RNA polymerase specialized sigma24 family protein